MKKIAERKAFINIAKNISELSSCIQYKVGAILVKNGRILSTGYNGTPPGAINCNNYFAQRQVNREIHSKFSEEMEIHAELNAILFAARNGISIEDSILFVTLHPCKHCLKMICAAGIKTVYYCDDYDKYSESKIMNEYLKEKSIEIIKIDLEGNYVNEQNK